MSRNFGGRGRGGGPRKGAKARPAHLPSALRGAVPDDNVGGPPDPLTSTEQPSSGQTWRKLLRCGAIRIRGPHDRLAMQRERLAKPKPHSRVRVFG